MNFKNRNNNQSNNNTRNFGGQQNFRNFNNFNNRQHNSGFNKNYNNSSSVHEIDTEIKQQIINYVYQQVDLSNYKYKLLEYENDLHLLKDNKHFVSANYNGINSLLVFIKMRNKFYSFIIDRKTLCYNLNQVDVSKVKFISINVRLDETIYNGTILDGVLLYNSNHHNNNNNNQNKIFVINDAYYFRGTNMIGDKINHKMINLSSYVDSYFKQDTYLNNIVFIVNKVYEMSEIKKVINIYMTESKYKSSIKGISFYPEISGTKLIYLYNNNTVITDEGDAQIQTVSPIVKNMRPIALNNTSASTCITNENLVFTFKIKNTEIVDVYNLYLIEGFQQDGKIYAKSKKICIAYIPTNECSEFCKSLFSNNNNNSVFVECKYLSEKDKWLPIKQVFDKTRPDELCVVEQKLGKSIIKN